ncbi:MAG: acyl-CoA-binding protein [Hymenobacter sp.]|nr:acyl-CoA-binding protein [Hymenobacter sp.]
MNLQDKPDLQQQFEAAVARVDNLPGDQAAAHMNALYGLYKQATEGDHDSAKDIVGDDTPDKPDGPAGLSQAQWDAWSQYKGLSEEDARRQYVQKANELTGPAGSPPATGSPAILPDKNSTTSRQPDTGPGVSWSGLRGDSTAGAPYGGEDRLKDEQN